MNRTGIEWADFVFNPITGCTHAGTPGCDHCYARRVAEGRLRGRCGYPAKDPFRPGLLHGNNFNWFPLKTKFPPGAIVFVGSMGDLFHTAVSAIDLCRVFEAIKMNPKTHFVILTKRPENISLKIYGEGTIERSPNWNLSKEDKFCPNLWIGVSCENQAAYDARWPELCRRWPGKKLISFEPLLGSVVMRPPFPDWIICGAETGPGARHMEYHWALNLSRQAGKNNIPFFFKKFSKGGGVEGESIMIMPREFPAEFGRHKAAAKKEDACEK